MAMRTHRTLDLRLIVVLLLASWATCGSGTSDQARWVGAGRCDECACEYREDEAESFGAVLWQVFQCM